MNCHRCCAHVVDDVTSITDTPHGLHVVVAAPVATHEHLCGCGAVYRICSTQPAVHHPGQLRLIQGAA